MNKEIKSTGKIQENRKNGFYKQEKEIKPKQIYVQKGPKLEVASGGTLNIIKPNQEVVFVAKIKHDVQEVRQAKSCPQEFQSMVENYTKSINYKLIK